ncbi:hypothetical protein EW026_g6959 [Hermanssonia centrifuga]|uniref:Uncharacterized protein n=1 Tax=Hermanssonia centrifuga TaxID=98765 RepID=A0A4S4K9J5_9APHY|nr:hypothetical protein EW026_g6959 [Hermanssonia centrifuga]
MFSKLQSIVALALTTLLASTVNGLGTRDDTLTPATLANAVYLIYPHGRQYHIGVPASAVLNVTTMQPVQVEALPIQDDVPGETFRWSFEQFGISDGNYHNHVVTYDGGVIGDTVYALPPNITSLPQEMSVYTIQPANTTVAWTLNDPETMGKVTVQELPDPPLVSQLFDIVLYTNTTTSQTPRRHGSRFTRTRHVST